MMTDDGEATKWYMVPILLEIGEYARVALQVSDVSKTTV